MTTQLDTSNILTTVQSHYGNKKIENVTMNMNCRNITEDNITGLGSERAKHMFEEVSYIIYGFALPSICLFGMVGNILNLTILTRRKLQKSFKTLEMAANYCLVALAVSDLMFCVFAFPTTFLPSDDTYRKDEFILQYRIYGAAIINVFIMCSTWLTVAMSLERYLAICYPLRQDLYLTTRRIKIVIIITYIFSFLFNIPVLWRYEVYQLCSASNTSVSGVMPFQVPLWNSHRLDMAYRIVWALLGNFVPLILLFWFNVCLCLQIYRSYKMRQQFKHDRRKGDHSAKSSGNVLTITLVVIVVMFFIFVAPSEIVITAAQMSNNDSTYSHMTIEAVMNFLQSLNFSLNFILYCIISPYFRKTLRYLFCCGCYNIYQVSKQWKKEFETSLM
ncbi:putative G-protein coupled receptor F59B2.13 [Gigantopelta aegis]|uniref:putative G-protein coupled receptor F59B2.13 n=1 Tax=Gigantopelta aegis TaxID=1735272 RepID=UPI001B88AAFE|nr:putative G-protein coupled receptor F59B2.13 [Gigantopelta aegis]